MGIGSEFDLSVDIKSIKSAVTSYADKYKLSDIINPAGAGIRSRIEFILFQFKNIFR